MSNETAQVEQAQQAEKAVEPAQLTIQDLNALANIIDLASKRGAFQATELSAVGAAYNKLHAFLQAVAAQQEEAQAESQPESQPE